MPLNLPDGYAEVTLVFSLAGDPERMTCAFGVNAAAADSLPAIVAEFENEFSSWMAGWSSDYTLVEVAGRLNNGGTILEETVVSNTVGGATAAVLPQNSAILVRKVTGVSGRMNRGRAYFPPGRLAEVDVSATGMIDPADITVIQGELDNLYDDLVADTSIDALVVLHTTLDTPTVVTALQLQPQIATQRRRLRG